MESEPIIHDFVFFPFCALAAGLAQNLFQSPAPTAYFTCGVWSPTRPSVIFLGRMDGGIDIWDFSDQSHKPSLFHSVTSAAITSMCFQTDGVPAGDATAASQLAVGDVDGHLHVLTLPKNLVRAGGKEQEMMQGFLQREEAAVVYFSERRLKLGEMREEMEKQQEEKQEDAGPTTDDTDKLMDAAEATYKKFELEWKAVLAEEEEARQKKEKGAKK